MSRVDLTFAATAPGTAQLAAAGAGRPTRLVGTAVPLGVPSNPSSDGFRYQFDAMPDNVGDLIDVVVEHDDDAVAGRLDLPFELTEAGDALAATARMFDTSRGRDLLVEAGEGVRTGFSVSAEFAEFTEDGDGVRHVHSWTARHLGVVRRPAFTQASGLTLAASAHTKGPTVMPDTLTPPATPPAVVELPTVAELAAQVADVLDEASRKKVHPLARFASHAAFWAEFVGADEPTRRRLSAEFALVDQITTNNPGVLPPGWRTDVKMNLDARRPLITGTGGPIGLPPSGLESNWPYFDGDLDALIAQQMAEKTELHSVRVDIKKGNAAIQTAGAASDISYQLLMRSSPDYLAAYQRIMDAAWARYTEAKFEAAALAAGTRLGALPADLTVAGAGDKVRALLFELSAAVEDATGAPASTVTASPDVWVALGGNPDLKSPEYGTQNISGTASAKSLRVNVAGLDVERAPFYPAGTLLATNSAAIRFPEQGPLVATEEDVAKLGRNVATWGMYVPAEVYFPAGVVYLDPAA